MAATHGREGWKRQTAEVLGAARPKGTTRNVPSGTAVLLRMRPIGCTTGPTAEWQVEAGIRRAGSGG